MTNFDRFRLATLCGLGDTALDRVDKEFVLREAEDMVRSVVDVPVDLLVKEAKSAIEDLTNLIKEVENEFNEKAKVSTSVPNDAD